MKRLLILLLVLTTGLSGCLEDKQKNDLSSQQASWFEGVTSVKNLGGYPSSIKVSWNSALNPVSGYRIYSLEYDPNSKTNAWTQIDEVNSDVTSYINSDLSSGQIYSYMVRAVDANGDEDTNHKQLSTVAFDGIASARATGKTTATVTLNTANGSFDEVRIYAEPMRPGASKTLVATAKGSVATINVTGLHSGVKYRFYAAAYMNYLGAEDGNSVYLTTQTDSDSYGSGASSDNNYAYRGFMSIQAFGKAPHAPAAPTSRLVRLTWPAFANATSSTKYKVVRAEISNNIDMTTSTACTSSIDVSCVVNCTNTGSGAQTCEDAGVGAPPKHYNYSVALVKKDPSTSEEWVEELPSTNALDFSAKVTIPSDNMVLIQRDAANYEMCSMLGQVPDPRKHQRCTYNGIAATPYNTGPGKPARTYDVGFYDFGYNLLVDRYHLACNWTRNSASCGANGCVDLTGTGSGYGPPASTLGNVGDTFFALDRLYYAPNCYYKESSGWKTISSLTDSDEIRSATTIDPGADGDKHNPIINYLSQDSAFNLCNAQTSDYGNKRLLRRREYVHAAAFATLAGEPGAVTDPVALYLLRTGNYNSSLSIGGQLPGYQRCASSSNSYLLPLPTTVTELLSPTNTRAQISYTGGYGYLNALSYPYFIGTTSTSNCVSRWGAQDPISPPGEEPNASSTYFSDSFIRTSADGIFPTTFAPLASNYDSGVVYDWGSYAFDGVLGPSIDTGYGVARQNLNPSLATTYPRYILPLGVPLLQNNSLYTSFSTLAYNGVLGSYAFNGAGNATINHSISSSTSTNYVLTDTSYNRFSYEIRLNSTNSQMHAWCAVEAE